MKYGPCRPLDCECGHSSDEHEGPLLDASVYESIALTGTVSATCASCGCRVFRPATPVRP